MGAGWRPSVSTLAATNWSIEFRISDFGRCCMLHRLESPPSPVFLAELAGLFQAHRLRFLFRPRGAELHPLLQVGDLSVVELRVRGHLEVGVHVADRQDEARAFHI